MVHFSKTFIAAVAAILATQVVAHPGHDISQEVAERNAFLKNSARRDLSHCASSLRKRGVQDASIKRREEAIAKARAERGLPLSEPTSVLLIAPEPNKYYRTWRDRSKRCHGRISPFYIGC